MNRECLVPSGMDIHAPAGERRELVESRPTSPAGLTHTETFKGSWPAPYVSHSFIFAETFPDVGRIASSCTVDGSSAA
jgi:hypothetical protein